LRIINFELVIYVSNNLYYDQTYNVCTILDEKELRVNAMIAAKGLP